MYGDYGNPYGYYDYTPSFTPPYSDEQAISIISTTASSGHASLESSGSSHTVPLPPAGQEVEEGEGPGCLFDMTALEVKTKQLSLDSAYTSEVDLDSSHNTTAANSGTASPKEVYDIIEESCDSNSAHSSPSSPAQIHKLTYHISTGAQAGVNKTVSEVTGQ